VVLALSRLMSQQVRGLSLVREDADMASAQLAELSASLVAIKCALSDALVCDNWDETEAIVQALMTTEWDLDTALRAEVASTSPPKPAQGRRSSGPTADSPKRRGSGKRLAQYGSEPASAGEIRMLLFRLSTTLDRLQKMVLRREQ